MRSGDSRWQREISRTDRFTERLEAAPQASIGNRSTGFDSADELARVAGNRLDHGRTSHRERKTGSKRTDVSFKWPVSCGRLLHGRRDLQERAVADCSWRKWQVQLADEPESSSHYGSRRARGMVGVSSCTIHSTCGTDFRIFKW